MKRSELIKKLNEIPEEDPDVCVFDWKQNLKEDSGDGTSFGIYPNFDVEFISKKEVPENSPEWIALSFKNEFIEDDI